MTGYFEGMRKKYFAHILGRNLMNTPNFYYLIASSSSCENDGSEGSYFGRNLHHTRHFPTSYSAVRAGSNFEVFSSSSVNLCLHFHLPEWIIVKKYFTFTSEKSPHL